MPIVIGINIDASIELDNFKKQEDNTKLKNQIGKLK